MTGVERCVTLPDMTDPTPPLTAALDAESPYRPSAEQPSRTLGEVGSENSVSPSALLIELDLRRRITRTVDYVDELLALDDLHPDVKRVCQAVRNSLTTSTASDPEVSS